MLPGSQDPTPDRSTSLRRWVPVAVIVAVVAGAIAVIAFASGDDSDGGDTAAPVDGAGEGALSFSDAEEQGIEVDWPDTCDTDRGQVAIPSFFAPECFAPFEGDNGGATDTGVTADTITIAYYQSPPNPISDFILGAIGGEDTNETNAASMQGYIDLFNTYYETYGREVELVPVEGSGPPDNDVAARADAVRIDEEIGAFAVFSGPILTDAFADELAARGIPCVSCVIGERNEFYVDRAPYIHGISANPEQAQDHVVEWLSKQVAGRPAEHAGPEFVDQERVFGAIYLESDEDSKALADRASEQLGAEGIELVEQLPYTLDPARLQEQAVNLIAKLKEAGATSIIFSGDPVAPETFTVEATSQDYFPEWIIAANALVDTNTFSRTYDQAQWEHAFGVTPLAARIDPEVQGSAFLYEWFTGEPVPSTTSAAVISPLPQTFFGGLQGVGPTLTREAWSAALLALDATPSAISQSSLNWGTDTVWDFEDYTGIDDFTEIWWDPDEVGPNEIREVGPGMWQFTEGGKRYLPGEWPERDTLVFDPEGAVAYYAQPPPGEEPPDPPSPAG